MNYPVLTKIEGDSTIGTSFPLSEARFLIGKSWDVSLHLPKTDVSYKHCTLEKINVNEWIVICHDRASIKRNNELVRSGLPVLLKCGDLLHITTQIVFKFECARSDCDVCVEKKREILRIRSIESSIQISNDIIDSGISVESYIANRLLLNQNEDLRNSCKKMATAAEYWREKKDKLKTSYSSQIHSYRALIESFNELLQVKEELEKHQNNDVKLLNEMVAMQSVTIKKLVDQLNEQKVNQRYNLRGATKTQTDSDKNKDLLANTAKHKEIAERLSTKNIKLQSEMTELVKKRQQLEMVLEKRLNELKEETSTDNSMKKVIDWKNEAVMEVSRKLTELVQNEFKCVICDEILVEAVVTNCNHTFCKYCLTKWEKINPSCPICRNISTKSWNAAVIDSFLSNFMPFVTTPVMQNWLKISNERQASKQPEIKKKRKFNFDNSSDRPRNGTLENQSTGLTVDLDDVMDWNDVILNLRNFTDRMGPTSVRTTNIEPLQVTTSYVVDLTEDDLN